MLAGQNGPCGRPPRGRTYTCTVEVLNVVPLGGRLPRLGLRELLAPGHSFEPPAGDAPARFSLQTKSAGCCGEAFYNGRHANASQSPVLPRARLAYDACLNAGSTAVLAHGHHSKTGAPIGLHAVGAHGRICTGTVRVLRAPSLHWTTWAKWCRVRDFHPQPLRSERSASGSWANAA